MSNKTGENTSQVHTLVPAADMPNHKTGTFEAVQAPDGSLVLKAKGNLKKGDQVFISYGKKCNGEFLANYGFVPENNDHLPCKTVWWNTSNATGKTLKGEGEATQQNVTAWRTRWRNHFARFYSQLSRAQTIAEKDKVRFAQGAYNLTAKGNGSNWDVLFA
mmetsp:Transcript_73170/g.152804  ORF Transcript_73170/g.152804 Transcript_73170/m.152804 type:complete len:161 (+) Transcript_73170:2-484(+)|eukprot:CAMPEP_0181343480 /NCGR_PEP_ID=MMETSP1101-20121128/31609_1 /TAXON_ID=46948 /ORGANISM="Rhodomonas abbreviata, Strain Caron Lab Isolate" /LENGTH=160 /DNA_ID=CAMNT_0023455113 /DNA_START=93 /DNA_END=575 /DNA_ORIENTATION=-